MFKKLSNLVPNTFMGFIAGTGVIGLIALFGTLYHYFSNPLAYTTPIQGILLGSIPTLLLGSIWGSAFLIKKHFTQKTEVKSQSELGPESDLESPSELTPDVNAEPTLTEQNYLDNQAEVEPKNLESEKKLDVTPEEELNLNPNLEPKGVEFETVSKPDSEEVNLEEPEVQDEVSKVETESQERALPEKTQTEKETQQLEFMKVRENLRKIHPANLAQSAVKPEPKSILKQQVEEIDSSSSESSAKKVQFANPIANVMNIRVLPEKEQPVEVEVEFAAVTHQEDKKDESIEAMPVKVKIEPAEEQPVVYHPQHDAQRAQTRQRRAQVNLQKNHDQGNVLPEGTTRNRSKVDRFSNSTKYR